LEEKVLESKRRSSRLACARLAHGRLGGLALLKQKGKKSKTRTRRLGVAGAKGDCAMRCVSLCGSVILSEAFAPAAHNEKYA